MAMSLKNSALALSRTFSNLQDKHGLMLALPYILIGLHLHIAPYTKVEESFNIQAIHDFLRYSTKDLQLFDHVTFPGSVPRSFFGARTIAVLADWTRPRRSDGLALQNIVRNTLAILNAGALFWSTKSIKQAYGSNVSTWYRFILASQFHIWFYASRTLPNTFAFGLCTIAFTYFLPPTSSGATSNDTKVAQLRQGFFFLAYAAVIFRAEIALLIASQAGYLILESRSLRPLTRSIIPGLALGAVVAVVVSVPQDTMLWQREQFFLPELESFWFNVFPKDHQGASAWGTSPWYWYFTSAIPRLVSFPALLLIPYGLLFTTQQQQMLNALIPPLGYTAAYSILPHKETRFLFPIVPQLTLALAIPASYLYNRRDKISKLFSRLLILSLAFTAFVSHAILLPLSAQSYPGGIALQELHKYHNSTHESKGTHYPEVHVHLTNLALQSGITRFLEQPVSNTTHSSPPSSSYTPPLWIYDKTPTTNHTTWSRFNYLILEPSQFQTNPTLPKQRWTQVLSIPSLRRSSPRLLNQDTARGCLVLPCQQRLAPDHDGLYMLFSAMYGRRVAWVYGAIHDVLREGYPIGERASLTRGRWVDWGLEERLVVLEKRRVESRSPEKRTAAGSEAVGEEWHGVKPRVDNFM